MRDAPHSGMRVGAPDMELRWRGADVRRGWGPNTSVVIGDLNDIVLFRQMAGEITLDHGGILTFLPKPISTSGRSGMYISFSFWDDAGNTALATGEKGAQSI